MPGILERLATATKIEGHQQVDLQIIGGSQVIQQWNLPDDKNKIKPALLAGKADVLTLSPIYLPDPGIENFVKLGLEHNPNLRITVQEFWLPYDDQALWANKARGVTIDPDKKTIEELRAAHAPYFQSMDDLVRSLNQQVGKQAVFVVPVGQAVLALREKIIKGEAPGITKQSELFADPLGHPRAISRCWPRIVITPSSTSAARWGCRPWVSWAVCRKAQSLIGCYRSWLGMPSPPIR